MKSLIEKPEPGMFKGVCRLGYWTADLVALMASGQETTVSKWDKKQGCNVFQGQCPAVEFTDRDAFDAHMREVHGKRKSTGDLTAWSQDIKRGWKTAKGTPEGKPFKPSTKDLARDLETCKTCGLVAEIDGTSASVRWWDAHERACAGVEQDVA